MMPKRDLHTSSRASSLCALHQHAQDKGDCCQGVQSGFGLLQVFGVESEENLRGHYIEVPVLPPTALQEKVIRCVGKDGHPTERVDGWRVNGHGESASSCPGR